jgi:hypothetical protein
MTDFCAGRGGCAVRVMAMSPAHVKGFPRPFPPPFAFPPREES